MAMHMHGFDDDDEGMTEADDSPESLVWQLLMLINPGDTDLARQQFAAWRDALDDGDSAPTAVERVAKDSAPASSRNHRFGNGFFLYRGWLDGPRGRCRRGRWSGWRG